MAIFIHYHSHIRTRKSRSQHQKAIKLNAISLDHVSRFELVSKKLSFFLSWGFHVHEDNKDKGKKHETKGRNILKPSSCVTFGFLSFFC
jgi:hypothetical protein